MPPAAAAIIPAVLAGASAYATGIAVLGISAGLTAGIVGFVGSLAMSAISQALAPKPPTPDMTGFAGAITTTQQRTQQVRQAITPWHLVYGSVGKSGPITFIAASESNKYLHMVVTLACHPCQAIDTVYLDDTPIYPDELDGDGLVEAGKYTGKVKIQWDLGTTDQPFADLVGIGGWTDDHRQKGRTKIYLRLEHDQDLFTRVPNLRVRLRGKSDVVDPRTATTGYTANTALCIRDYMIRTRAAGGMGVPAADVQAAAANAAANICDEIVTTKSVAETVTAVVPGTGSPVAGGALELSDTEGDLCPYQTGDRVIVSSTGDRPAGIGSGSYYAIVLREKARADVAVRIQLASSYANALAHSPVAIEDAGSGTITVTKTGEPRYALAGVVVTDRRPFDILQDMRTAMAGRVIPVGGEWILDAGAWSTPTVTYDEDDLAGPVGMTTRHPMRERFNAVQGVYVSPLNFDQPTDYPPVTNSTYETADGERLWRVLDLPFTPRSNTAQRIATIELNRHRREITARLPLSLAGLKVKANDTVSIDNTRYGWSGKSFEIGEWSFVARSGSDGAPALGCDLVLRESDSDVYAFDPEVQEQTPSPAPATTLPDAFTVLAPTSLTLTSGTTALFRKTDGTIVSRIFADWTDSTDAFVSQYSVQYKRGADSDWLDLPTVLPGAERATIWEVEEGVAYDVRVRAANVLGIRSAWVTATGHVVVGKTALPADVASLLAQQNGNVVTFRWPEVTDADLSGYELRYAAQGGFNTEDFRSNTLLTQKTRGTLITNAGLPPGAWTVGIVAVDTSGNLSETPATFDITVTNANDVVATLAAHPGWIDGRLPALAHDFTVDGLPAGISFSRASVGTYENSAGELLTFASGAPRVGDRGLLIESARTNSFLNSAVPASHTSPSLGTGTYTLWCKGAGSVQVAANGATITGAGTATEGSPVTFVVTSGGTVDFTVTGVVTLAQCENGAYPTSFILTAGSAATRAADVATLDTASIAGFVQAEGTLFAEVTFDQVTTNEGRQVLSLNDNAGTLTDYVALAATFATNLPQGAVVTSSAQANIQDAAGGPFVAGTATRLALAFQADDFALAARGVLVGADTSGSMPADSFTKLFLGRNSAGTQANVLLRQVFYWPRRLTNAELVALTDDGPDAAGVFAWTTDFIRHDVSGRLVPESGTLASAMTDAQLWDSMVHDPVASPTFEATEIDLGFDANAVRVFGSIGGALGPGETGAFDAEFQIDTRDEAGSYDGFEDWGVGAADFRRLKARLVADTGAGVAYIGGFTVTADVEERTESFSDEAIAAGGTTVTFAAPFHLTPAVQVTAQAAAGAARYATYEDVSTTSVKVRVFDGAGDDVGGVANIDVTGA
jgi:hypothetical protein